MAHRLLSVQKPPHENTRHARARAVHADNLAVQNDKAAQVIASRATSLADCIELLAMLGLDARHRR